MRNTALYSLVLLVCFLQNSIAQAEIEIDKEKYWRTEQISDDIYMATDTNCIQHVYNNEGELLLSLENSLHHFAPQKEDLYYIRNYDITEAKKITGAGYETMAYYWYYNQELNLLQVDEAKVLYLKNTPYLWIKSGRNSQLLHADLTVRLDLGEAFFNSLGDYYWLDDPIEQEIRIYAVADDKELLSITGEEYEIHRGKFKGITNGGWTTFLRINIMCTLPKVI
ncbi:MAG: hypothetical protein MK212_06040 [Saprospiraceae bacterium]|nr:hypothetical protein [Saprospiraceae bacterium]